MLLEELYSIVYSAIDKFEKESELRIVGIKTVRKETTVTKPPNPINFNPQEEIITVSKLSKLKIKMSFI